MSRLFAALAAIAVVFALGAPAMAQKTSIVPPGKNGLTSVKIGVTDLERSVAFYTKYLGMKRGAKFNDFEQGLVWDGPDQGSPVVLVNNADKSGRITMVTGAGWLVVQVADIRKFAKDLTDGGFKVGEPQDRTKQYGVLMLTVKDPDGNRVETVQIVGPPAH
jgi:catechol 2,3-dioxygenase-like lactoylglutathione lyase family enzyme